MIGVSFPTDVSLAQLCAAKVFVQAWLWTVGTFAAKEHSVIL